MRLIKYSKILISVLISFILIYYITKDYKFNELNMIINQVNFKKVTAGFLVMVLSFVLGGLRWKLLFKEYTYIDSFNGVIVAVTANTVIPARGGELVRSHFLKRITGINKTQNLGRVIIERAMDFAMLFFLLSLSFLVFGNLIADQSGWLKYLGFTAVIAGIVLFLIYRFYTDEIHEKIDTIGGDSGLRKILSIKVIEMLSISKMIKIKTLLLGQFITVLISLLSILSLTFYLNGCGINSSYKDVLLIYPLVALSISLPITVGYVGVYHGAMIVALTFIGFSDAQIVGKVILVHLLTVLPPVLYGAIILSYYYMIRSKKYLLMED